jgi:hypothetical protein
MTPVLGHDRADKLIDRLNTLERLDDVRQLRPLWD